MIKDASNLVCSNTDDLLKSLKRKAKMYANIAMVSRTHGQTASPTTMGKEFANFVYRINAINNSLKKTQLNGKINGAVGNFNAHTVAYPDVNWELISKKFVNKLGLKLNTHTNSN